MMAAAQTIGSTIAKAKASPSTRSCRAASAASRRDSIPWPVVIGRIRVSCCWRHCAAAARGGGFLPGLILGNMMGRSTWGGRGSGGFGGYDSGDGFGGFGGGDSGGGGASSDW